MAKRKRDDFGGSTTRELLANLDSRLRKVEAADKNVLRVMDTVADVETRLSKVEAGKVGLAGFESAVSALDTSIRKTRQTLGTLQGEFRVHRRTSDELDREAFGDSKRIGVLEDLAERICKAIGLPDPFEKAGPLLPGVKPPVDEPKPYTVVARKRLFRGTDQGLVIVLEGEDGTGWELRRAYPSGRLESFPVTFKTLNEALRMLAARHPHMTWWTPSPPLWQAFVNEVLKEDEKAKPEEDPLATQKELDAKGFKPSAEREPNDVVRVRNPALGVAPRWASPVHAPEVLDALENRIAGVERRRADDAREFTRLREVDRRDIVALCSKTDALVKDTASLFANHTSIDKTVAGNYHDLMNRLSGLEHALGEAKARLNTLELAPRVYRMPTGAPLAESYKVDVELYDPKAPPSATKELLSHLHPRAWQKIEELLGSGLWGHTKGEAIARLVEHALHEILPPRYAQIAAEKMRG